MKKINILKSEGVAEVIDKILAEPDNDIVLVIPKASSLVKSARNFSLLKRESDAAGKKIALESVDEMVVQFAKENKIEAVHPLWSGVRGPGVTSDIVPKTADEAEPGIRTSEKESSPKFDEKKWSPPEPVSRAKRADDAEEDIVPAEEQESETVTDRLARRFRGRDIDADDSSSLDDEQKLSSKRKRVVWGIVVVVLVILFGGYLVTLVGSRADVAIHFKKTPWNFQNNFIAQKSVAAASATGNVMPAQIFTQSKNTTQSFPASGSSTVSIKATGVITIYNAYNTSPQELVAKTRFLTPDGKLFRLVDNVIVPGGKMENGQLTPASIDAPIVADQPGPAYNVGPVAKLSIPGFANTPRASGFYGTITKPTTGGFTGKRAVPTAADIADAKMKTMDILQSSLQGAFAGSYPNNFKILDGATSVAMGKLIVSTTTDDSGNFTVFGQASLQAIGFDESAIKTYLLSVAQNTEDNSVFASLTLNYGSVHADFSKGQVSFSLSADGTLEPSFSADNFRSLILGKRISDARAAVAALPNLSQGTISVWPIWLWNIPASAGRVHVDSD